MRHLARDLTGGGRVGLTKALLTHLERDLPQQSSGYELYLKYFEIFTLFDEKVNLSCWNRSPNIERSVRKSAFKDVDPSAEPAFLSLWSQQDVERLGELVGKTLVIYLVSEATGVWEIFHDFRPLAESDVPCAFFALVLTRGKKIALAALRDSHDELLSRPDYALVWPDDATASNGIGNAVTLA
jgi:hypothetical protein